MSAPITLMPVKAAPMKWGPPAQEAMQFGLPLTLFNKADRICAVTDFAQTDRDDTGGNDHLKSLSGFRNDNTAQIAALEREKKTRDIPGIKTTRGRGGFGGRGGFQAGGRGGAAAVGGRGAAPGGRGAISGRGGAKGAKPWVRREQIHRNATVSLSDEFQVLHRLNLSEGKWTVKPPVSEDLRMFQIPKVYDSKIEDATPKKPFPLPDLSNTDFSRALTKFDSVIRELTAKSTDGIRTIFTTDTILAQIMCAGTQLNSWDVEIQQFKHFTFVDTRKGGGSMVDTYWVDENAGQEAPNDKEPESMNSMSNLGRESSMVCRYIAEACRTKTQFQNIKTEKSPFAGITTMFKYRQYTMDKGTDQQYRVVVRCEVDCVDVPDKKKKDDGKTTRTFALLERPGQKWRERLDKERGRILMGELQRNRPKFAKWAVLSYLSNVDQVKVALVSRVSPNDNTKHHVLTVETMTPIDLLKSLSLRTDILWGLVNQVFTSYKSDAAPHIGLLKEPSVNALTLFVVPEAKDEDSDSDSDSGSDSSSDSSSSSDSDSSDSDSD